MTDNQIAMVTALAKCTFLPGSFQKRFANDLASTARNKPDHELTAKQSNYLAQLFHMYRKQIGSVEHNKFCELCHKQVEMM